ncbi:MAG TPA: hypothetical protein VHS97_11790, partial [Isosphaeraceae bacterium]|nr:hypothetical protein [Isosphaeraceae bacterium]
PCIQSFCNPDARSGGPVEALTGHDDPARATDALRLLFFNVRSNDVSLSTIASPVARSET